MAPYGGSPTSTVRELPDADDEAGVLSPEIGSHRCGDPLARNVACVATGRFEVLATK